MRKPLPAFAFIAVLVALDSYFILAERPPALIEEPVWIRVHKDGSLSIRNMPCPGGARLSISGKGHMPIPWGRIDRFDLDARTRHVSIARMRSSDASDAR